MKTDYMNFSLILFLIGILGFVLNRKNIILMLISIEIMLLSITFLILISSLNFDDILGQTFAIYIITIAGAESAIGLGILVAFYRFSLLIISYCSYYNNNINNRNTSNNHNRSNDDNNYKSNKRFKFNK
jgi:NADH-ubiquinone oxidoreductase chain 4L